MLITVGLVVLFILYRKGYLAKWIGGGKGPAKGLTEEVTLAGKIELPYLKGGESEGTVVMLLHGFSGDKEQWVPLASALVERGWSVLVPDLPGFGATFKTSDTSYDPTYLTKMIRSFARRTRVQAIHMVGHGFGAMVAAGYAYASPTEILTLSLIEPMNVHTPYQSDFDAMVEQGRNPLLVTGASGYESMAQFVTAGTPDTSSVDAQVRARALVEDKEHYRRAWDELRNGNRSNLLDLLLPEIKAPTMVVLGARSKVVHSSTAQAITQTRKDKTTRASVVQNAGHLPHVEYPEDVATTLEEFFRAGR